MRKVDLSMIVRRLDFRGSSTASTDILLIEDNEGDARLTKELLQEACSSRFSVEHVDADGLSDAGTGGGGR